MYKYTHPCSNQINHFVNPISFWTLGTPITWKDSLKEKCENLVQRSSITFQLDQPKQWVFFILPTWALERRKRICDSRCLSCARMLAFESVSWIFISARSGLSFATTFPSNWSSRPSGVTKKFSNVTLTQTCSKHPWTCRYIYNQSSITTRTRNKTIVIKEVEQCHIYIYFYLSIGSSRSSQTSGG